MRRPSMSVPALKLSLLPVLLAFGFAAALALLPHAQASQDNRQLQRDASRVNARERRVALVIGNGAYTNAPPLKNPPNDARDMAATLKTLGFEVMSGVNVNQREMKRLIREFGQSLKAGGSGLFYYAGHGVQSKGRNYLIPIEADIQSEVETEDAGVDVNLVLGYMDDAQNGLNIVILDACRSNPFARTFRSVSNGLAQVDAPTGTLIAYATAPGRVASDGAGQNGLYTSELLKQMKVSGLSVTEIFMRVRAEVMKQTANKQVPWEALSLVGNFYFTKPNINDVVVRPEVAVSPTKGDTRAPSRGSMLDPEQHDSRGRKYLEQELWAQAETEYREAIKTEPREAVRHNNLGVALSWQGRYAEAETEYAIAANLQPDKALWRSNLAKVLTQQGKYQLAEVQARKAAELAPGESTLRGNLGLILSRVEKVIEAEAEYEKAIQLQPDFGQWHYELAQLLYQQRLYEKAVKHYEEAIRLEPTNAKWHSRLGAALWDQDRFPLAEAQYIRAAVLDPKNSDYRQALQRSFTIAPAGKVGGSESEYREIVRLAPTSGLARYSLARFLELKKKGGEAESEYKKASELEPEIPWIHYRLAIFYEAQNRWAAAETEYRVSTKVRADIADFHHRLAFVLRQQKKWTEAEDEAKAALHLDPKGEGYHDNLLQIRKKKKRS